MPNAMALVLTIKPPLSPMNEKSLGRRGCAHLTRPLNHREQPHCTPAAGAAIKEAITGRRLTACARSTSREVMFIAEATLVLYRLNSVALRGTARAVCSGRFPGAAYVYAATCSV